MLGLAYSGLFVECLVLISTLRWHQKTRQPNMISRISVQLWFRGLGGGTAKGPLELDAVTRLFAPGLNLEASKFRDLIPFPPKPTQACMHTCSCSFTTLRLLVKSRSSVLSLPSFTGNRWADNGAKGGRRMETCHRCSLGVPFGTNNANGRGEGVARETAERLGYVRPQENQDAGDTTYLRRFVQPQPRHYFRGDEE